MRLQPSFVYKVERVERNAKLRLLVITRQKNLIILGFLYENIKNRVLEKKNRVVKAKKRIRMK